MCEGPGRVRLSVISPRPTLQPLSGELLVHASQPPRKSSVRLGRARLCSKIDDRCPYHLSVLS